ARARSPRRTRPRTRARGARPRGLTVAARRSSTRWGSWAYSRASPVCRDGRSTARRANATAAPTSCAATNPGTHEGAMPANVSVSDRATVTAGFANDVDDVNQYAAPMYDATAIGAARGADSLAPWIV